MKSYHNIERNPLPSSQYLGYDASGDAWRIVGQSGAWYARHGKFTVPGFHARTLSEVSERLAVTNKPEHTK